MTVTVVYSDSSDAEVSSTDATYTTARSGSALVANTGTDPAVGQLHGISGYTCYETFLRFDTSAIPDGDVVSAATVAIGRSNDSTGTDFTLEARARDWGATVETADFVAGASLGGLTLLASTNAGTMTAGGVLTTLTSTGSFPGAINKTGFTSMVLVSDRHRSADVPGNFTNEFIRIYPGDNPGTTLDPTLTVTHAANNPPSTPTGLSATTVDHDTIDLSWTASTDDTSAQSALVYEVSRSLDGSTGWSVVHTTAAGVVTYSDSGLTPSTPYYYRVRAQDEALNWSGYSTVDSDTTAAEITEWTFRLTVTDSQGLTDTVDIIVPIGEIEIPMWSVWNGTAWVAAAVDVKTG